MMRHVTYSGEGGSILGVATSPLPIIKEKEVLINVVYSGLNRSDIMQRKGLVPVPKGESNILGLEASGYIHKTHVNSRFKIGDKVMCLVGGGGMAEYLAVDEDLCLKVPDEMNLAVAGSIPEAWLTAFQLLYWISNLTRDHPNNKYNSKSIEDKVILVHAGASGVGTSLIQMLKNILNIKTVYATVGSEEKKNFLQNEIKVTRAFNYKDETEKNFDAEILKINGGSGVDVVFDCVGSNYWQKNADVLNVDGEWVLYGTLSGGSVNGNFLGQLLKKRIVLSSTTLRTRSNQVYTFLTIFRINI
jgi:tumor protein p53-inducible protein 3